MGPGALSAVLAGLNLPTHPRLLVGLDPLRMEEISRLTRPVANEYAWPWCVEMAIWDLIGKALERTGFQIVATGLQQCMAAGDGPDSVDVKKMEKLFLGLA